MGRILCERLAASGVVTFGCDLSVPRDHPRRRACDLTCRETVADLLDWAGPCEHVFHLAAASSVASGLQAPAQFMRVNIEGTIHLCEALSRSWPTARLIYISSAEIYGHPDYLPLDERHPVRPLHPYAISKSAAEQYCLYMGRARRMDVVVLRPFNHSGAGQGSHFVLSSFARQVAEMEKGLRPPVLRTGDLSVKRDFSHVLDVVRAYEIAATQAEPGETYNICSGRPCSLSEVVDFLRGLTSVRFAVETDPERLRPVDVPEIYGSSRKFRDRTGWQPDISFPQILTDLLACWREHP